MSLAAVRDALLDPAGFAGQYADDAPVPFPTYLSLLGVAVVGVSAYGGAMHLGDGLGAGLSAGGRAAVSAGVAWNAALPCLYVIGGMLGSGLSARLVALAASVTVSWGGLAMLASVPVLWFFQLCIPEPYGTILASLCSFAGVGLCMMNVFLRIMTRLEGRRFFHLLWLGVLSALGAEMFTLGGLFNFQF